MLITEHPMGVAQQDPTPPKTHAPAVGALRADACAMIDALDAAAKAGEHRAVVFEDQGTHDRGARRAEGPAALHHRTAQAPAGASPPLAEPRRLRTAVLASLVEATELCIRESNEVAAALDPWRLRTIGVEVSGRFKTMPTVAERRKSANGLLCDRR